MQTWDYGTAVTVDLIGPRMTVTVQLIRGDDRRDDGAWRAFPVIPGHPHHVTRRGDGGARAVFSDADDALDRVFLGSTVARLARPHGGSQAAHRASIRLLLSGP